MHLLGVAAGRVLFHVQDFSSVAEKTGTYTAFDYADIMEHLGKRWKLADRTDLTGEVSSSLTTTTTGPATSWLSHAAS